MYGFEDDVDCETDGVVPIELPFHAAINKHKLELLDSKNTATILLPSFWAHLWVNNESRQKYWVHPASEHFQQIPEKRRTYPLQFCNQKRATEIDSRKTQHHGYIRSKTKNQLQVLARGACFQQSDGTQFMVVSLNHRGSRNTQKYHASVMTVRCMRFRRLIDILDYQGADTLLTQAQRCAAERIENVLVLDARTEFESAFVRLSRLTEIHVDDVTTAPTYSESERVFFVCGVIRGQSAIETQCVNIRLESYLDTWRRKECGLDERLFENEPDSKVRYHILPYMLWPDGHGVHSNTSMGLFVTILNA